MKLVVNVLAWVAVLYWIVLLVVAYVVLLVFWQLFKPLTEERQ